MSGRRNSSSEEEGDFNTNINLPNFSNYKHHRNKSKTNLNLVNAGKKLVTGKSHPKSGSSNRPSPYQRQSYMSGGSSITNNSSVTNQDSSESDSDPEFDNASNLPNFGVGNNQDESADTRKIGDDDDDDDDENFLQSSYDEAADQPDQLDETDSEDDDGQAESPHAVQDYHAEEQAAAEGSNSYELDDMDQAKATRSRESHELQSQNSKTSKNSKNSKNSRQSSIKNHFFRRPSLATSFGRHRAETDITDQVNSAVSRNSQDTTSRSGGVFKDILRKVALTDQQYPEHPNGDTLIGRMYENDSGSYGLSGGGMTPGASRFSRERPIDEEEELAMSDDELEMQKLNFASLNNEARNLINIHVPESMQQPTFDIPGEERDVLEDHIQRNASGSSSDSITKENEKTGDDAEAPRGKLSNDTHRSQKDSDLYAPNPDLFLRGNVQSNNDADYMLLDEHSETNVAPPTQVQAGVLSSLLRLYQNQEAQPSTSSLVYDNDDFSVQEVGPGSKTPTNLSLSFFKDEIKQGGKKVYDHIPFTKRTASSQNIINEEGGNEEDGIPTTDSAGMPSFQNAKPKVHKKTTVNPVDVPSKVSKRLKKAKKRAAEQLRITVHIADVLQRQRFIMLMCKALMLFGAPTHRLEEYMIMTSRVLEIDGQFIYLPGVMIMAFGDAATRTSEVHLVKCAQGVNLSKLSDTHQIYKNVIHDLMGVDEASAKLNKILKSKNNYNPWLCVLFYGLGSSMVCPFAFSGGWTDIPISFGVGLCVGYLQFFVSSMSNLYSSVFEVTSSIVVSFIARAIGSINGGETFCFSAIAQGSLALILPGYIILCGSLELQSRNLVAGSVRMFYAIIYSLFLGFGITLGAALYGWVDSNSVSATSCSSNHSIDPKFRILFVPAFTCCLGLINQANLSQLPTMVIIAGSGYVATFFAGEHFQNVSEFTACIGAFIVGILGNLYSRIWKGLAVSAMLPAIFVQVPSGIASQSSLLSGIRAADEITNSSTSSGTSQNTNALAFGSTMVEVSIGISVGLFAAALVIYPFGKKKTGLFSL